MAKKKKNPRASKKNLAQNTQWLEEKLESLTLDIDSISSKPIDEVKDELSEVATDTTAFIQALNEKLPDGTAIKTSNRTKSTRNSKSKQKAKTADRDPSPSAKTVKPKGTFRFFSLRSAFIASVLVILLSVLIPQFIRGLRETDLPPATAVNPEQQEPNTEPPTWIEGPAANEMLRGVRYKIEGLQQVAIDTPLPNNPGDHAATFKMRLIVNGQGMVTHLEPMVPSSDELEPAVIDSLLRWRFNAVEQTSASQEGIITVEYLPE